jgi:hypothetical protein
MSTERQQQASRENGAKSHGPVTPAGRLNSSQNALKHGMLSGTLVLKCESTDRFENLVATLFEEFQPQTPFEESLIEDMAVARWRRMRIRGMEKAGMDYEMRRQSDMSHPIAQEDSATRASFALRTLSDESGSLELMNRYDSRYQREYLRAHRRFEEVRDRRTPPPPQTKGPGLIPTPGVAKTDRLVGPPVVPPAEPPAPEESVVSKGTPEAIENRPEPMPNPEIAATAATPNWLLSALIRFNPWRKLASPVPTGIGRIAWATS